MSKEVTITVYQFSELKGKAKEKAADKLREWVYEGNWWEFTANDLFDKLKEIGVEQYIPKDSKAHRQTVYFSLDRDRQAWSPDTSIMDTKKFLRAAICNGCKLTKREIRLALDGGIKLTHTGHNYIQMSVELEWDEHECLTSYVRTFYDKFLDDCDEEIEYQTSEEQLSEMSDANDVWFEADGRIAHV